MLRSMGNLIEAAGGWCILSLGFVFCFFLGAYSTFRVLDSQEHIVQTISPVSVCE